MGYMHLHHIIDPKTGRFYLLSLFFFLLLSLFAWAMRGFLGF